MSKHKRGIGGLPRPEGWASLATNAIVALERMADAAAAMLADPTPAARRELTAAHSEALSVLLAEGPEAYPQLVRPLLFAEHPVVVPAEDLATVRPEGNKGQIAMVRWPVHLFPLSGRRTALRFGENLIVFEACGKLERFESTLRAATREAAEALNNQYAEGEKTAGQRPLKPYFLPGTPGSAAEEHSFRTLAGWKPR